MLMQALQHKEVGSFVLSSSSKIGYSILLSFFLSFVWKHWQFQEIVLTTQQSYFIETEQTTYSYFLSIVAIAPSELDIVRI